MGKISKEQRAEAIRSLGSQCSHCSEKDVKYLDIYKDDSKQDILLCGNCYNLMKLHRDIFDSVVPKGKASKFDIDLSYGKQREHRFHDVLNSKMEIKSDRQARRTGNIYVEYESRGKPGGIEATTADFWVQEVDDDVFVIMPVSRMRELVYNKLDKYGPTLGGDANTSKGVLLRLADLLKPIRE